MRYTAILLSLLAAGAGAKAAWHWYVSSKVEIDPGWTLPGLGRSEPVDEVQQSMEWLMATIRAFNEVATLNKIAAKWTAASVALSAAAAIVSLCAN